MLARDEAQCRAAPALVLAVAVAAWPAVASGSEPALVPVGRDSGPNASTQVGAETKLGPRGQYLHLFGAASVGRGLRFNNPYRLQTQLGDTGESLSLSATYLDLALGAALTGPVGLQHGGMVHFSEALEGVPQDVITPSYVALLRLAPRWLIYGRGGVAIVLRPDATGGLEAAAGAVWYVTAGTGLTAELVGSIFYGAATDERGVTTIPVLSMQLGAFVDYEVLP